MYTKEELEKAYNAGVKSVEQNKDRDERLEKGAKVIEIPYNFETWFEHDFNSETEGLPLTNSLHEKLVKQFITDPMQRSYELGGWGISKKIEENPKLDGIIEQHSPDNKNTIKAVLPDDIYEPVYIVPEEDLINHKVLNDLGFSQLTSDFYSTENFTFEFGTDGDVLHNILLNKRIIVKEKSYLEFLVKSNNIKEAWKNILEITPPPIDQHSPVDATLQRRETIAGFLTKNNPEFNEIAERELREQEKLKSIEEKFIIELNCSEFVKVDETDLVGKHVQTKMYPTDKGVEGNLIIGLYDTDPNKAKRFDSYGEAQKDLDFRISRSYSEGKTISGSINKIFVARPNDLEKKFKIGETVMAARNGYDNLREMELFHFSSYGYDEVCVRDREDSNIEYKDWFWTKNFKKIEK